jgi:hypothetical protein
MVATAECNSDVMFSAQSNWLEFAFSTLRLHEEITIGHVTFLGESTLPSESFCCGSCWKIGAKNYLILDPPRQKRLPRFWRR